MSFTRRSFLLGTAGAAAGLIIPSYYQRALEFLDETGVPLLEPANTNAVPLYAGRSVSVCGYELSTMPEFPEFPEWTLQDFADRYGADDLYWSYEEGEIDFAEPVDWSHELFYEKWYQCESPVTHAYDLLKGIDLGPELTAGAGKGEVLVWNAPSPASCYQGVEAVDEISISLLQKRLDDLGKNFAIHVV
jgi:hypothetical protein